MGISNHLCNLSCGLGVKQAGRNNKKATIQHQANKDYRSNSLTNQECNHTSTYTENHWHSLCCKSRVSVIQSLFVMIAISLSYPFWQLQHSCSGLQWIDWFRWNYNWSKFSSQAWNLLLSIAGRIFFFPVSPSGSGKNPRKQQQTNKITQNPPKNPPNPPKQQPKQKKTPTKQKTPKNQTKSPN